MSFGTSPRPYIGQGHTRASADYLYDLTEDRLLVIIDQDSGEKSVTNDMVNVLADIAQTEGLPSLAGVHVTHRDSDGDWNRVVLSQEGRYERVCSFGLRVTDEAKALELLRQVPR